MDYKQAVKAMNGGDILPVYLCFGPEDYLLQEFISFATDKLISPQDRDFAVSRFDLSEVPVDAVIEDAETLPFMTEKKLIIAGEAQFFTSSKVSAKVEHDLDRLLSYCKAPVDHSVILFTVSAEKLDERKKIVKSLKQKNALVAFPAMSAEELLRWVQRQAEKAGSRFAAGAADSLILSAGTSLRNLSAEINKLTLYVGQGGEITPETIDHLTTRNTEQNIFMLVDEIIRLRLDKAFAIYHELLKKREDPIKILMLVARQFRIVLQVKALAVQGHSNQQMASMLGLHPYAVKIAAEQAKAYAEEKLTRVLAELAELDYRMKSGGIDKVLGMELFLFKLVG